MKRIIYYGFLMIMIVVILPLLIVRGDHKQPETTGEDIPSETLESRLKIKVYISSQDKVREMFLEEYIKGVVAAEMPAEFGIEALKAQAVAARSYAFGRMKKIYTGKDGERGSADICTDYAHCQAWVDKQIIMKKWGVFSAYKNWNKIEKAVNETKDIIIVYDGKVINPLFHSNSGGKTENAEDVWEGVSVPYLKSVPSSGEDECREYKSIVKFNVKDFYNILIEQYPDIKLNKKNIYNDIKVLGYTEGGRVRDIKIGNITMKGTEFRKLFSLRSANFKIKKTDNETLEVTVIGNGHGAGMSQWGANYLAKSGGSYEEILKYYYKGVELINIRD